MKDEFVSRHGKRTPVITDDMTDPARKPQIKKPHPRRKFIMPRISRRAKMVVLGCLVVAAIAAVVSADSVKRDYERQAAAMNRSIADAGKTTPSDNATAVAVANGLLSSLAAPTHCRVSGIDVISWYGPAKSARQDCQATAERYNRLRTALTDMRDTSSYIEHIHVILQKPLSHPGEAQFAIINDVSADWTAAHEALMKLVPPAPLRAVHDSLVARVLTLKDRWARLDQANQKRDIAGFKAAEADLAKPYEDLRQTGDELTTVLQKQQTAIMQAIVIPA